MSNRSLTIVLPVYNGESRLTNCVQQMLELASDLTSQFSILIVDDGSTDDTSAVAQELSTRYPQVKLRRHRQRSGLGPIISMVRRRVDSDVVIVHDGVTPIDAVQVRRLWRQSVSSETPTAAAIVEARYQRAGARSRDPHGDGAGARARDGVPFARAASPRGKSDAGADDSTGHDPSGEPSRSQPTARESAISRRCRGPIFSPRWPSSRSANSALVAETTCPVGRRRWRGALSKRFRS